MLGSVVRLRRKFLLLKQFLGLREDIVCNRSREPPLNPSGDALTLCGLGFAKARRPL